MSAVLMIIKGPENTPLSIPLLGKGYQNLTWTPEATRTKIRAVGAAKLVMLFPKAEV